ncbi:hypothetical protein Ahy_Scaffold1g106832 isoform C [Arachis hypogaea]|uniref:Transposase MuDR plant domain-containing protein n=1 Tax=Arachis hypogaea TaxID=3818 RepID=A0A444WSG2_ARAHY|nr:hypothetical protein Ahy_Scaffold1g106832 isoform C [Arachis hypogaea]
MQQMLYIYQQIRSHVPMIELYVEFEQQSGMSMVSDEINVDELGDINWEEDNNDSEVQDEANAIVSQHPFGVPSFMRTLDLEAMYPPEFSEYANTGNVAAEDDEFSVGMEFGSRESVISAIKSYTISRGVDYTVYESEPQTFYAKCKGYGAGCDWLIQASLIRKKACWEIKRYNGKHTCTMGTISQDHAKLDSDTIADAIRPLVEADPSIKLPVYRESEEIQGVRVLHRVFWSFYPCIVAFKHYKPLVQVDGTHLYGKYKGALLVAVAQDGNKNIVPIAFAIVEGETADAWEFFLTNLWRYVVAIDGVGIISDRHTSIDAAIACSNGVWSPPRAWHMYCIRHIGSNFLRRFKAPYLHKLVVNTGISNCMLKSGGNHEVAVETSSSMKPSTYPETQLFRARRKCASGRTTQEIPEYHTARCLYTAGPKQY